MKAGMPGLAKILKTAGGRATSSLSLSLKPVLFQKYRLKPTFFYL